MCRISCQGSFFVVKSRPLLHSITVLLSCGDEIQLVFRERYSINELTLQLNITCET